MRLGTPAIVSLSLALASLAFAQQPHATSDLDAHIAAKRMEIRHHTEQMQTIQDPAALQRETQRHFVMVEQLLAAMLEQQKQGAAAPPSASAMPMEGEMAMPGMGAAAPGTQPGMMDDDMMEMPAGGASSGNSSGGMGGMGGMRPGSSGSGGGMMGDMHGEHGMGMGGSGASMGGASDAAKRLAEREALLAEVTRHSQHIETLTDSKERSRELVRHQRMLDQLLDLMR